MNKLGCCTLIKNSWPGDTVLAASLGAASATNGAVKFGIPGLVTARSRPYECYSRAFRERTMRQQIDSNDINSRIISSVGQPDVWAETYSKAR